MAAIAERLWERGHEQDSSKARRVGWEASALTEVLWGQLVPQALGHSDTMMHMWELPVAPWQRNTHLASSRVLQCYRRAP